VLEAGLAPPGWDEDQCWTLARIAEVIGSRFRVGYTLWFFALDGTDHATHKEQASMIRRYIIWRNNHAYDQPLRQVVTARTLPDAAPERLRLGPPRLTVLRAGRCW
jgi:hypothetical protein